MVTLVFTVGSVNILMGYALAYYLRGVMEQADQAAAATTETVTDASVEEDQAAEREAEREATWEDDAELAAMEVSETIPAEWVDRLKAESIEARTLLEATAQVMRLETDKYREALVRLEETMRQQSVTPENLNGTIRQLVKVNRQWLKVQAQATGHLNERLGSLGPFDQLGRWLEKTMLDQQAQIETTCNNLSSLDTKSDLKAANTTLINEFARLINMAHELRDGVSRTLLSLLGADDRLDILDEGMREDSVTGFRTQAGFELDIAQWLQDDPGRERMASALLIDLAGLAHFNRQFGTRVGDRLIAAAGSLLNEVMRKNRGFEVVARIRGQQFLLFFGDTGPRGATSAAERMRQSFADADFELGEQTITLTVSCAVCEFQSQDDTATLLERLEATLQAAKESGGNCTTLDEGDGPQPVTPPDYQLPSRIITVD